MIEGAGRRESGVGVGLIALNQRSEVLDLDPRWLLVVFVVVGLLQIGVP